MNLLTDQRRRKTVLGLLIVFGLLSSTAVAQPEATGPATDRTGVNGESTPEETVRGNDLLIRDINGELQLLKKNIDRAALIEWLNRRELGVV